ncbi:MAG: glutathione S-transferase domain-containing protein, partial [Gammaproteobacteria bacterium]
DPVVGFIAALIRGLRRRVALARGSLKLRTISQRQRTSFVIKDDMRAETQAHVEAGYRAALSGMTEMLQNRHYLLGNAPSLADFGLMGPMLRHSGQDPAPAEIMRNEGPAVFNWLSRVWNARQTAPAPVFLDQVPDDARILLKEICETHLLQLAKNAAAYAADAAKFEMTAQGCQYRVTLSGLLPGTAESSILESRRRLAGSGSRADSCARGRRPLAGRRHRPIRL